MPQADLPLGKRVRISLIVRPGTNEGMVTTVNPNVGVETKFETKLVNLNEQSGNTKGQHVDVWLELDLLRHTKCQNAKYRT